MFAHAAPATTVRLALLQEGPCNLFGGGTARPAGSKDAQESAEQTERRSPKAPAR
jgi:hypothetical protein